MKKIDQLWFILFSELIINLSAGWFGTAFIVPNFVGVNSPWNFLILTGDIMAGTICLLIAFKLRKYVRRKN